MKKHLIMSCVLLLSYTTANGNIRMDTLSAKNLGAVANGNFNNTAVFNRFPDNAIILLDAGTYLLDAWVLKGRNIKITGKGKNKTIIRSSGKFNDHTITLNKADNIIFENFTIDGGGDRMPGSSKGDGAGCMTISNGSKQIYFQAIRFQNAYNKQVNVLGSDIRFTSCEFISNRRRDTNHDGLHIYGGEEEVKKIVVESCLFSNHERAGIYSDLNVSGVTIRNCTFDQSKNKIAGGIGINIQAYGAEMDISGNRFISNKYGVQLRSGATQISINRNTFQGTYSAAVSISCSYSVLQIIKTGEKNFSRISTKYNNISAGTTLIASNITITDNSFLPGFFGKQVLEPTTSAFVLFSGCENKLPGNYENIVIKGNNMQDHNKSFNYFICFTLSDKDRIRNINVDNNVISGIKIGLFGYFNNEKAISPQLKLNKNIIKNAGK